MADGRIDVKLFQWHFRCTFSAVFISATKDSFTLWRDHLVSKVQTVLSNVRKWHLFTGCGTLANSWENEERCRLICCVVWLLLLFPDAFKCKRKVLETSDVQLRSNLRRKRVTVEIRRDIVQAAAVFRCVFVAVLSLLQIRFDSSFMHCLHAVYNCNAFDPEILPPEKECVRQTLFISLSRHRTYLILWRNVCPTLGSRRAFTFNVGNEVVEFEFQSIFCNHSCSPITSQTDQMGRFMRQLYNVPSPDYISLCRNYFAICVVAVSCDQFRELIKSINPTQQQSRREQKERKESANSAKCVVSARAVYCFYLLSVRQRMFSSFFRFIFLSTAIWAIWIASTVQKYTWSWISQKQIGNYRNGAMLIEHVVKCDSCLIKKNRIWRIPKWIMYECAHAPPPRMVYAHITHGRRHGNLFFGAVCSVCVCAAERRRHQ